MTPVSWGTDTHLRACANIVIYSFFTMWVTKFKGRENKLTKIVAYPGLSSLHLLVP